MKLVRLGEMKKGFRGVIQSVDSQNLEDLNIKNQLLDMGLIEGSPITIQYEAPFGGDPIAVFVRGATIALRRREANLILVQEV